jgi:hypothetical protein
MNQRLKPALLLFLVTSFELISLNALFNRHVHNFVVMLGVTLWSTKTMMHIIKRKYFRCPYSIPLQIFKSSILISSVVFLFFVAHACFSPNPWPSLKYAVYAVFFIFISEGDGRTVKSTGIYFVYLVVALCIMAEIQFLVLNVIQPDMNMRFFPISGKIHSELMRYDADYVNPFYLGYLRIEDPVVIGPLRFIRANAYTTESKYFSSLCWLALGFVLISGSQIKAHKKFITLFIVAGMFLAHAYTSILVIAATGTIFFILRIKKLPALLLATSFVILPTALGYLARAIPLGIFNGYARTRFLSFLGTWKDVRWEDFLHVPSFGYGVGVMDISASNLVINYWRFGILGIALLVIFLIFHFSYIIQKAQTTLDLSKQLGVSIFLATLLVFFLFFHSQPLTLLVCFSICYVTLLVSKEDKKIPVDTHGELALSGS